MESAAPRGANQSERNLRPAEWPATLDVSALFESGWRPSPVRQFIIKVHGRCNLACDYCYVYEMADQSWRDRPRTMSPEVLELAALQIAEHARRHGLDTVDVVLHGGEPLLVGIPYLDQIARRLRRAATGINITLTIQTNGVLLTDEFLRVLAQHRIRVGVSIDGTSADHDRHRRFPNGRGSSGAVLAALERLTGKSFRSLFAGLLCTIDLAANPLDTYASLLRFRPPTIDFLLPHGDWSNPPPRRSIDSGGTPYADWLIPIFGRWYDDTDQQTDIRLFREIIHLLLGGHSITESVGLSAASLLVVETDGSWEQVDTLKGTYERASTTGLHVARDSVDDVLRQPGIVARQLGLAALSDTCHRCALVDVCGGGLYAHRYREGSGFKNPSVYCLDLQALIVHIRSRLAADLDRLRKRR